MKRNLSRTKADLQLHGRLNEIRMPSYERLIAQAHLARAEAISDLIVAAIRGIQSLAHSARHLVAWPARRAS
jgi:hypothetical protein